MWCTSHLAGKKNWRPSQGLSRVVEGEGNDPDRKPDNKASHRISGGKIRKPQRTLEFDSIGVHYVLL
jgi:hypothetical protein